MEFKPYMVVVLIMAVLGLSWPVVNTLMQIEPPKSEDPSGSVESLTSYSLTEPAGLSVSSVDTFQRSSASAEREKRSQSVSSSLSAEEFVERKREDVWQDQHGNFRSEAYLDEQSQWQRIIADGPIYYPNQWQLLESFQGCSAAGYYVDSQTRVALIDVHGGQTKVFYYICSVDEVTGEYVFLSVDPVDHLSASVKSEGE
ncbi:hypothetical protein [Gilvimarinus xylanilyticus]|uniref:Uncharacterized protein n=1 Tax=Gilvimarinus xylanilyticus TaxID=2944139 RepID=A0A9X2KUB3_9GAMM|nr:hypothetical protein [Gilvimarinus xylanilyticus]MCP8900072.1 hypothetical protein [Gilvimarinus xylanilyticus]